MCYFNCRIDFGWKRFTTSLDNIILPAVQSKKNTETRKETVIRGQELMRKLGIIDIADNDINEVMEELVKLNKEGTTIMMVTHDAKVASRCSRVLYIVDGNIKGEYISPKDADMKEKDRERLLNNWLMELGW